MGYRTFINICMYGEPKDIEAVEKEMHKVLGDELADEILNNEAYIKWYYIEDDFFTFAKHNPNVLIIVAGYGDEQEDIWEARWKGEDYECQESSIPPFKNEKLQIPNPIVIQ